MFGLSIFYKSIIDQLEYTGLMENKYISLGIFAFVVFMVLSLAESIYGKSICQPSIILQLSMRIYMFSGWC